MADISQIKISNVTYNIKDPNRFSGSYNDLTDKPTIPAAQVLSDWNATTGMGVILNKPSSLPANGGNAATVGGFTVGKNVPSDAVFTDNNTTYKLNINGTNQGGGTTSLGTVYAPTAAGTAGLVLLSSGGAPNWKTGDIIHYVTSPSGTAGTKSKNRTQWSGTVDGVTSLYTGLMILIKVPVAGVNVGVGLTINSLGEHPVILNANTLLSAHYPVDSILPLVYDADQTASLTVDETSTSYTGCWKIANYDANTTYSTGTAALLNDGTNTTNRIWQAKIIADYVKATAAATASPANGGNAATVNNHSVAVDVPSSAKFTDTTYKFTIGTTTNGDSTNGIDLGTLKSETAAASGTTLSLVTTGEKATWNGKLDALTFNSTPSSSNKVATMADIPSTLPASDVSSWAKQSSKPSYAYSEIGYVATAVNGSGALTLAGTDPIYIVTVTANISSVALTANPSAGHSCHVIFVTDSNDSNDRTVAIAHNATDRVCPAGTDLSFTVPKNAGGYIEVDFLSANNKVYVRGV